MFRSVLSAMIAGVEAVAVQVEADVSDGLPSFSMVGCVSTQVKEAQDRVRTALRNAGLAMPPKRIVISFAPGDLRKDGTRFDLPIAAAVLQATGVIGEDALADTMVLGELHLDGEVERVRGVLPSVLCARELGCKACLVPAGNVREGRAVEDIRVVGIGNLLDLIRYCHGELREDETGVAEPEEEDYGADFSDIRGQAAVKRAALIAAAGFHNLLLAGPPGSGKSMTAQRIPTILPPLSREESLELTRIYSVVGLLPEGRSLLRERPYRAPHHSLSRTALCGGGLYPRPGEVTLAHRGVLFLDELPEMQAQNIEMLRQPLEDRKIRISRLGGSFCFPASFLLVAAMNPCPCGYYPDMNRCTCTPREVARYRAKTSQALLDRIDLRCEVPSASYEELTGQGNDPVDSASLRAQVEAAMHRQKDRYKNENFLFNSELPSALLDTYCPVTQEGRNLMSAAFDKLGLSARGLHRILRVARTIADLDGKEVIGADHVGEAILYRSGAEDEGSPGVGL